MVDVSGSEGRDPLGDFETINRELAAFSPELAARPMLVAGNKCDLAADRQAEDFAAAMRERGYAYFPMMAAIAHGTEELVKACAARLAALPPIKAYEPEPVRLPEPDAMAGRPVRITGGEGVYQVEGEWLLQVMRAVNFDDDEGLRYFERVLQSAGVIAALREAGASQGDTVSIYGFDFDFVD